MYHVSISISQTYSSWFVCMVLLRRPNSQRPPSASWPLRGILEKPKASVRQKSSQEVCPSIRESGHGNQSCSIANPFWVLAFWLPCKFNTFQHWVSEMLIHRQDHHSDIGILHGFPSSPAPFCIPGTTRGTRHSSTAFHLRNIETSSGRSALWTGSILKDHFWRGLRQLSTIDK